MYQLLNCSGFGRAAQGKNRPRQLRLERVVVRDPLRSVEEDVAHHRALHRLSLGGRVALPGEDLDDLVACLPEINRVEGAEVFGGQRDTFAVVARHER